MEGSSRRLVFLAVAVGLAALVFGGSLWRWWIGSPFPGEELRRYQAMYQGQTRGRVPRGQLPFRTGKVVVVEPSQNLYYIRGTSYPRPYTQIHPSQRGKITAELDPPRLDESWFDLDSSLRAENPEEVDTVILCEHRTEKTGIHISRSAENYRAAHADYRKSYLLKVFDRQSGRFIGEILLEGEGPGDEGSGTGAHRGEPPDVADVIASMPLGEL